MPETAHIPPAYTSPEYATQVETSLRALQDSHRLAIHQWEYKQNAYEQPAYLKNLNRDPQAISPCLETGKRLPLFSMTLLPSTTSGRSIRPYLVQPTLPAAPGYLFDLDQQREAPAKVVRASVHGLDSGTSVYGKKTYFQKPRYGEARTLEALYLAFASEQQLRKCVATDPSLTDLQLNFLGDDMAQTKMPFDRFVERPILNYNEILVAATNSHIKALSIPLYHYTAPEDDLPTRPRDGKNFSEITPKERLAIAELSGALHGLNHLKKGMDLPVVFYHVNGPNLGKITFFAQGHEALTEKAMTALSVLKKHHTIQHFDAHNAAEIQTLAKLAKKLLGIQMETAPAVEMPPHHRTSHIRVDGAEHHGKTSAAGHRPSLDEDAYWRL